MAATDSQHPIHLQGNGAPVHDEVTVTDLEVSGTIPPELDALILRCLAKSPGERPADAAQLDDELAAIAAAHPWTAAQSWSWWESHRPREPR